MRKLTVRFTIYFSVGLLLFLVYLLLMSSFLLKLFSTEYVQQFIYIVDGSNPLIQYILVLLFCFLSGGALFSIFLVYPLIYIMNTINSLSTGNLHAVGTKVIKDNGKLKLPYFLYKEVIMNIIIVSKELQKSQLEREHLDKSKNDWIAGVSHDLKTPLSYITGYSSLILNKDYQWEFNEVFPYVEEIYNKGMLLEKLIEDLNMTFFLDHMDVSMLKLNQVDLISFLRNIMADIANNPKAKNYDFTFESKLDNLEINVDERLMHRAIYNLLTNALDHNSEGTEITMKVFEEGKEIHVEISDNGIGIDKDTLNNIFERYYSKTEVSKQHKGLGLNIVKQIMNAHNAKISVKSSLGNGTAFYIVLSHNS